MIQLKIDDILAHLLSPYPLPGETSETGKTASLTPIDTKGFTALCPVSPAQQRGETTGESMKGHEKSTHTQGVSPVSPVSPHQRHGAEHVARPRRQAVHRHTWAAIAPNRAQCVTCGSVVPTKSREGQ
jgi:hypothetical protein